jgi:hypothetical protein
MRHGPAFVLSLTALLCFLASAASFAAENRSIPKGVGSLSSRLLDDGSVCAINPDRPSECRKRLLKIPRSINRQKFLTFYGLSDVDNDGNPEVFLDYWPGLEDHVVLLVYKKKRGTYRLWLHLKAETMGYAPAAWFLNEPPHPKAIFMTRYGGSSGDGLFYLDLNKKSLDLISGNVYLENQPTVEDIDGDGMAEIFLPGRGRDRTGQSSAAVLHWKDEAYQMWWPDWPSLPYVIYAELVDIDRDGIKEIVAVLEPEEFDDRKYVQLETKMSRKLGVWKLKDDVLAPISIIPLPDSDHISYPTLGGIHQAVDGVTIDLEYTDSSGLTCTLTNATVSCTGDRREQLGADR